MIGRHSFRLPLSFSCGSLVPVRLPPRLSLSVRMSVCPPVRLSVCPLVDPTEGPPVSSMSFLHALSVHVCWCASVHLWSSGLSVFTVSRVVTSSWPDRFVWLCWSHAVISCVACLSIGTSCMSFSVLYPICFSVCLGVLNIHLLTLLC